MSGRRRILIPYSDEVESDPNPNSIDISSSPETEFIDVPDDYSPHSPVAEVPVVTEQIYDGCPVSEFLSRKGLKLRREWLDACLSGAEYRHDIQAEAKYCFERFLVSDMNCSGAGILPPNVDSLHLVDLTGPFILQVDEVINVSSPLKSRYQETAAGVKRCLKLSMTDGVQRVFGMEYRPIKDLKVLTPAGFKVVIYNAHVRRGLILLVPESIELLGGVVEEFEAARQRLVSEVNKPPRGRRANASSLSTRASHAAWSPQTRRVQDSADSVHARAADGIVACGPTDQFISDVQRQRAPVNVLVRVNSEGMRNDSSNWNSSGNNTVNGGSQSLSSDFIVQEKTKVNPSTRIDHVEIDDDLPVTEHESNQASTACAVVSDIVMLNDDRECFVHPREQGILFSYLANLSTKWAEADGASTVKGKIKCFLTGVKEFHYKKRTTYELWVYVDDGSLISEIRIDHNLVRDKIGYNPDEVTSALSSSNAKTVRDMKELLKKFQVFLMNFEGIMLVELDRLSAGAVALEMKEGCPASDSWLLLRRLKSVFCTDSP